MRHLLSTIGLLLLVAFLVPSSPADDDTDPPTKKATPTKSKTKETPPKEKKGKTEYLTGKLTQVEGAQRYLTVQVTQKVPQENAGAAQNIMNLKRQLIGNTDRNSIRSIYIQMAQEQQKLITYKDETKNLELQAVDELKVRTMLEPVEYDDKGKVRKLTEKEKRALKGPDRHLPGYPADFDSLKPNQTVQVYLAKSKDAGKAKAKDKDAATEPKDRPKITMIVVVAEPVK
jgi:hypothetical protein